VLLFGRDGRKDFSSESARQLNCDMADAACATTDESFLVRAYVCPIDKSLPRSDDACGKRSSLPKGKIFSFAELSLHIYIADPMRYNADLSERRSASGHFVLVPEWPFKGKETANALECLNALPRRACLGSSHHC